MSGQRSLAIRALVDLIQVGNPVRVQGGLTLVPLVAPRATAEAALLEESPHELTELTDQGVVNAIKVHNLGARALLLLDGEEVIGAKQNRIFNATFLVPPGAVVEIPVSCVEQGRWQARSRTFRPASRTVSTAVRTSKLRRVTSSALTRASYDAGQRAVWNDVDAHLRRTTTMSRTMAYADAADARSATIAKQVANVTPERSQVGHVAVLRDRLLCVELFGSSELYLRAWPKLARGLLAEDMHVPVPSPRASGVATRVMSALRDAKYVRRVAPGSGRTFYSASSAMAAAALVHDGAVFHLLATPSEVSAADYA